MRSFVFVLCALVGCVSAEVPVDRDTDLPSGAALGKADDGEAKPMSNAVHWVRNSAEYRALALQAYANAAQDLAETQAAQQSGQPWAVVMDADETIISNAQYQREREAAGLGYSPESWTAWTQRREATAMPGASAFMDRVHELGGLVAVVTNRTLAECDDSRANFQAVGLTPDVVLCKNDTSQKEARFTSIEDGSAVPELGPITIAMFVGDNIEDFPDLEQALRLEDDDAFASFGSRYVVIPNPMYGSFEKNPRD